MTGVFDSVASELYTTYRVALQFRDRIVAGIPADARLVESWLMKNMGVTRADEIRAMTLETLRETGVDIDGLFTDEELATKSLAEVAKKIAAKSQTTVFKRSAELGLYIESRQLKAMLKEATAIVFPYDAGNRWGRHKRVVKTKEGEEKEGESSGKTPRSYLVEQITIEPLRIPLGVTEPSGVDLSVQHVVTPQGPRSSLSYYEYVDTPRLELTIEVLRDSIQPDWWAQLWVYAGKHGLGAKRSQDQGRFDVVAWEQLAATSPQRDSHP